MIRKQQNLITNEILPYLSLDFNPLSALPGSCALLTGVPEKGRLQAMQSSLPIRGSNTSYFDFNFRYTRNGAQESRWISVSQRDNTNKYTLVMKQGGGSIVEIFPANTGFGLLVDIPFIWQVGNRMFFSDGTTSYVYDGRSVRVAGLTRSTTAPTVSAVAAGSLTAATGLKACITWVVLDEQSNRVHESSRSDVSSFQVLAAENLRVDIGALSAPSGATHWSVYVSELNGSNIYRRHSTTTAIGTTTIDISALPAATSPKAPIRNDPMPPSNVGCVAKNRILLRDSANRSRYYFSALGEVEGLLNGSGAESFPGYGTNTISDISNSDTVTDREITAFVEHDNTIYMFTESKGLALVGELNLLDNRSPRSLVKLEVFPMGCIGPRAVCSTPYGLVWMTPGKRLVLWNQGQDFIDLGEPIQLLLDQIRANNGTDKPGTLPSLTKLHFYQGEGRQWLMLNAHGFFDVDNLYTLPIGSAGWAQFACDMSVITEKRGGAWFRPGTGGSPSSAQTMLDLEGTPFLLVSGRRYGTNIQPIYFNEQAQLGKSALGPASLYSSTLGASMSFRPNLITPTREWVTGHYITITMGDQRGPNSAISTGTTVMWTDIERPYNISVSSSTVTAMTALTSGESRLWMVPEASGNTNVGGSFGKRFVFQFTQSSAVEPDNVSGSGHRLLYHAIYGLSFSYSPQKPDSR